MVHLRFNILQQEFHQNPVFHLDQLWTVPDPNIAKSKFGIVCTDYAELMQGI